MEAGLRLLNIVRMVLLVSIVMYALMAERVAHKTGTIPDAFFLGIAFVAFCAAVTCFVLRQLLVVPVEEILRREPGNAAALRRWSSVHLVLMTISESVALFGFVLRFQGAQLIRVVPFYAVAVFLLLFLGPRRPVG
jgi:hypothetical protein